MSDLQRIALQRIEDGNAPLPIRSPIVMTDDGRVMLPVPDVRSSTSADDIRHVSSELHAGCTIQWAPMLEAGGVLVEFRGGLPDGDADRDAVSVFFSLHALTELVTDLAFISTALRALDDHKKARQP